MVLFKKNVYSILVVGKKLHSKTAMNLFSSPLNCIAKFAPILLGELLLFVETIYIENLFTINLFDSGDTCFILEKSYEKISCCDIMQYRKNKNWVQRVN